MFSFYNQYKKCVVFHWFIYIILNIGDNRLYVDTYTHKRINTSLSGKNRRSQFWSNYILCRNKQFLTIKHSKCKQNL